MANTVLVKDTKICVGDLVKISQTSKEKDKERVSLFDGRVISIKGRSPNKSFTVRKIGVDNIAVEKIFPVNLPSISKVEVKKSIPVRRAKLYYLRGL